MDSCQICGKKVKENGYISLAKHITQTHKISTEAYYDMYLKVEGESNSGKCVICSNPTVFKGLKIGYKPTCCHKCGGIYVSQNLKNDEEKFNSFRMKNSIAAKHRWNSLTEVEQNERISKMCIKSIEFYRDNPGYNIFKNKSIEKQCEIKEKLRYTMTRWWENASNDEREVRNGKIREGLLNRYGRSLDDIEVFKNYASIVRSESNLTYRKHKQYINPSNFNRSNTEYHLDHKFSIANGFINNVPIEVMSSRFNLEMIPAKQNLQKNHRSSITLEELYELYNAETETTEEQ